MDLWDIECHRAITAEYLRGNLPPTALNNPHVPLAYHSVYDCIVAVVLTALPLELTTGMAIVSIGCVVLTVANLAAVFPAPVANSGSDVLVGQRLEH